MLERIQSSKFALIVKISVFVLTFVILITSLVIFLKISQNKEVNDVNVKIKTAEDSVSSFKSVEETLFALKNRLNAIQTLRNEDEKVKSMLSLIIFLIPPEVTIYDASVDKNGTINASFSSKSLSGVQSFFSNLSSKEKNSNLISKVDLDGISLGKDYTYRFALKIYAVK